MPELPEVETTRRGLLPLLRGRVIDRLVIRNFRLRWPVDPELPEKIRGATIDQLDRRAKYLLMRTNGPSLLLHLGMSGSLRMCGAETPLRTHDHLVFHLDDDQELRFHDPRRFGCCQQLNDTGSHRLLEQLGPEPLEREFSGDYLFQISRTRKVAVKALIMEQRVVVGVGNIYATEALFRAGIRPHKAADRIRRSEYHRLHASITDVLNEAIAQGGTTLRDFVREDGSHGYFRQQLQVYGREHQPCARCNTPIQSQRIGGRASAFCPRCQR